MADFDQAVEIVLMHEGIYGNLRGDPGGPTMFGWSMAECERLSIEPPMTREAAIELYRQHFWNAQLESIASQTIATKLFDDTVNQGSFQATLNLQQALCGVGSIVKTDGELGPATLQAIFLVPEAMLLPWMRVKQFSSYERWMAADPARSALRNGLANRAAWPDPDGTIAKGLLGVKP